MIYAALNGEGVALGRLPLLSRQIREGKLVAPFEKSRGRGRGTVSTRAYYMLVMPGAQVRPEVRSFTAWLLGEARAAAADAPTGTAAGNSPARKSRGGG